MREGPLVHFDGAWTPHDRVLVERAVLRAERVLKLPVPPSLFGRPWICSAYRGEAGEIYVARRINLDVTLEGASAPGLVEALRRELARRAGVPLRLGSGQPGSSVPTSSSSSSTLNGLAT